MSECQKCSELEIALKATASAAATHLKASMAMNDRPDIIPIPIRDDFVVRLHIPLDLTETEARKIGAVMLAYASKEPRL